MTAGSRLKLFPPRDSGSSAGSAHRKPPRTSSSFISASSKPSTKSSVDDPPFSNGNIHSQFNVPRTSGFHDSATLDDGIATKTCMPSLTGMNPVLQWRLNRRTKIASNDVVSVGNASDTLVPVFECSDLQHLSGRDLHESAKFYLNAGKYEQALESFEAILQAQEQRFAGPNHPSVGAAMHNVGVCRQRMQQHDIAESYFIEAVEIRENTLGVGHLEVAVSLSKLGATRATLGKFEEAFVNLRRAISIAQKELGYEHKTVAQMLCHLACFYFEAGELYAAEAAFTDACNIYRKLWPESTDRDACMVQLTDTLCNKGSIQNRRKQFATAAATFSEALDLQLGIYSPSHQLVIATLDNLGFAYSKQKDYVNARLVYQRMYKSLVSTNTNFTDACMEAFQKQIVMLEKLKLYEEAVKTTKVTLNLQKSMLPRDHKIVQTTEAILASLAKKVKRPYR